VLISVCEIDHPPVEQVVPQSHLSAQPQPQLHPACFGGTARPSQVQELELLEELELPEEPELLAELDPLDELTLLCELDELVLLVELDEPLELTLLVELDELL